MENVIPIDPFTSKILLALVAGITISGLAALSASTNWGWKKFLYTFGLAVISGFAVVDVVDGGINGDNAIGIFLEIVGASFLANKLFGIGSKLKGGNVFAHPKSL
jgi:hypothetical protein